MSVPPDRVCGDKQTKSHQLSTLVTLGKSLSREAGYFMIVMMAAVADLINP